MNVVKHFSKLYEQKRELALLQWAYVVIGGASVLIAGVFALINQQIGVAMLIVPLVTFVALAMNIVAWALIKLAADSFLVKKPAGKSTKKTKKSA